MSHNCQALSLEARSLEARSDEAFEFQVRAQARRRVRQAHAQRARHAAPPQRPSALAVSMNAAIFGACSPRDRARGRRWKQAAQAAALAAFGAGMLWPVDSVPQSDYQKPQATRLVRVVPGELLASLDAPAPHAH